MTDKPVIVKKPTYIKVRFMEVLETNNYRTKVGKEYTNVKILVKTVDNLGHLVINYNHPSSTSRISELQLNDEFLTNITPVSFKNKETGKWFSVINGFGIYKDEFHIQNALRTPTQTPDIPKELIELDEDM